MADQETVCDSCLTAAYDEGAEDGEVQAALCRTVGVLMADHTCDEIETDGEIRCACSCKQQSKRRLRYPTYHWMIREGASFEEIDEKKMGEFW